MLRRNRQLKVFILTILPFFVAVAQEEPAFEGECQQQYTKGEIGMSQGVALVQSAEDKDKDACKGKVGESFCLVDKKKEFVKDCIERKVASEQKDADKAVKLNKIVRDAQKKEDEEKLELERIREEEIDFIDQTD